jgi:hypothetical protein
MMLLRFRPAAYTSEDEEAFPNLKLIPAKASILGSFR